MAVGAHGRWGGGNEDDEAGGRGPRRGRRGRRGGGAITRMTATMRTTRRRASDEESWDADRPSAKWARSSSMPGGNKKFHIVGGVLSRMSTRLCQQDPPLDSQLPFPVHGSEHGGYVLMWFNFQTPMHKYVIHPRAGCISRPPRRPRKLSPTPLPANAASNHMGLPSNGLLRHVVAAPTPVSPPLLPTQESPRRTRKACRPTSAWRNQMESRARRVNDEVVDDDLAWELVRLKGCWVVVVAIVWLDITSRVAEVTFHPIPVDAHGCRGRTKGDVASAGVACPGWQKTLLEGRSGVARMGIMVESRSRMR